MPACVTTSPLAISISLPSQSQRKSQRWSRRGFIFVDAARRGNAVQPQNILELVGEYFDARVTLFTLVFVIVATVEAGFFFYQLRLKRQITRVKVKAATTVREVANETTALLARLNEHDLERELWLSITEAMKKT